MALAEAAEGKTGAMVVAVPGGDAGAAEVEVAGCRAGVGKPGPVAAVGTAVGEVTGVPAEVPTPEQEERYIFYQSA